MNLLPELGLGVRASSQQEYNSDPCNSIIPLQDCAGFCKNDGMCTLTGPGMTPMCSCGSNFKGQRCEETVLWFQFFVRDNKCESWRNFCDFEKFL